MGLKLLSSIGLTPGTSLMALIQQSLAFYICRRLNSEKWQNVQWELSGANVEVLTAFLKYSQSTEQQCT